MSRLRNALHSAADLFDRVREPGWPRRIAILVVLGLALLIPYPLSITGDFEMISLEPHQVRNKVAGTVSQVLVKMGQQVEQGQVVARLLAVEHELELARVEAQIAEAEARLRMLEKGYRAEEIEAARYRVQGLEAAARLAALEARRMKTLAAEDAIPPAELDRARSEHRQAAKLLDEARQELLRLSNGYRAEEVEQAAARVAQLEGRRAEVQQELEWTALVAPQAGRVVTTDAELQNLLGAYLERGTAVVEIVAAEDLVARITIEESEFGDVELGQKVLLRPYQFPSLELGGQVESIEPFVESPEGLSTTVSVLSKVEDPGERLRMHTSGKAKIVLGPTPVGSVLFRRVVRSALVRAWSWY